MLNYANLNDMEFEALCKDIMERKLGVSLRRFGPGRDHGVDLTDDVSTKAIVVQVKHYRNSTTEQLVRSLKNELHKVTELAPQQYYICCSRELSADNINALYQHFQTYMVSDRHIVTLIEIDDFLKEPINRDILEKHTKLWMDDTSILKEYHEAFQEAVQVFQQNYKPPKHLLPSNLSIPECFDLVLESRSEDIQQLATSITLKKPVFIWGFPGLGKTELSIAFARKFAPDRTYLIRYSESMRDTIINLRFMGMEDPDLRNLSKEERFIVEDKIYKRKLAELGRYPSDSILIIDNFDSKTKTFQQMIQEPAYLDLLGTPMHLIITTRNQPDDVTPEIRPLKTEFLLKLIRRFIGNKVVEEDTLLQLLDACGYHTLSAELIGKAIGNKLKPVSPTYILQKLRNNQLKRAVLPKSRISKDRTFDEDTIYGHLKALFDISCLSEIEKNILCHSALLPIGGVDTSIFLRAECGEWRGEDNRQAVEQLVSKGWLHVSQEQVISVHPLIRDLVNEDIGITYEKCKLFLYWMFDGAANDQLYRLSTASSRSWAESSDSPFAPGGAFDYRSLLVEHFGYMEYTNPTEEYEDCKRLSHMIAEVFANAASKIPDWSIPYAADAAFCFNMAHDREMCLQYSHLALDGLIRKIQDNPNGDRNKHEIYTVAERRAILGIQGIWCPQLEEQLWDIEHADLYGNELYMDHSGKPIAVQNIYTKLRYLLVRDR